ncbi:MAG: hypothetical protein QOI80_53, partial [Solirubrobacteraceae bacterium]|nr:hypothetical protein [Solirubrobacteraceae bacterium]
GYQDRNAVGQVVRIDRHDRIGRRLRGVGQVDLGDAPTVALGPGGTVLATGSVYNDQHESGAAAFLWPPSAQTARQTMLVPFDISGPGYAETAVSPRGVALVVSNPVSSYYVQAAVSVKGKPWRITRLASTPANYVLDASFDSRGRALVTWVRARPHTRTVTVRVATSDTRGRFAPARVVAHVPVGQILDCLTTPRGGQILFLEVDGGRRSALRTMTRAPGGRFGRPQRVGYFARTPGPYVDPDSAFAAAVGQGGRAYALWSAPEPRGRAVEAATLAPGTSRFQRLGRFAPLAHDLVVGVDAHGRAVAAYSVPGGGERSSVHAATTPAAGARFGRPHRLSHGRPHSTKCGQPAVATSPAGQALIGWDCSSTGTISRDRVQFARYSP